MNLARVVNVLYHSFQSVFHVNRMKGFERNSLLPDRSIRGQLATPNHRMITRLQKQKLKPAKRFNEPFWRTYFEPLIMRMYEPVYGMNEPLRRKREPLRRIYEPLIMRINEPVYGMNEPLEKRIKKPILNGINEAQRGMHAMCYSNVQSAPFIHLTPLKAVVIYYKNENYASNSNVNQCQTNYSLNEACDMLPVKIAKLPSSCRSTARKLSRQSKTKRVRHREPSRISLSTLVRRLRRRKLRNKVKRILRKNTPTSSIVHKLTNDYKTWYVNFISRSDNFFSSFFRPFKKSTLKKKTFSCTSDDTYNFRMKCFSSEKYCVSRKKLLLAGDVELNPGPIQNQQSQVIPLVSCTALVSCNELLQLRLQQRGLRPFDVGGSGDCFFKAVSHKLYGDPGFHLNVRAAGIEYMRENPERFIESNTEHSWLHYVTQMSMPGTWADGLIIQAVADQLSLKIFIVESRLDFAELNVVEAVDPQQEIREICLGHIDETHYVSTLPAVVESNICETQCSTSKVLDKNVSLDNNYLLETNATRKSNADMSECNAKKPSGYMRDYRQKTKQNQSTAEKQKNTAYRREYIRKKRAKQNKENTEDKQKYNTYMREYRQKRKQNQSTAEKQKKAAYKNTEDKQIKQCLYERI